MLSPYENIIIGNFLYSLGLAMGRRPRPVEACINLTQQTPLDQVLGDVMLQFPGAWRLIEFKRAGANIEKEDVKLQMFTGAARAPAVLKTSLLTHWFVVSGDEARKSGDAPASVPILVRPYLQLHETGGIGLEDFAQSIVDEAHGPSLTSGQLDLYMKIIQAFGTVKGTTAGLLVGVDTSSSSGGLYYLPLENVADLRATARVLLQRQENEHQRTLLHQAALDKANARIQELERQRSLEREAPQTKQRDKGLDLSR